jgi:hypothetical protein
VCRNCLRFGDHCFPARFGLRRIADKRPAFTRQPCHEQDVVAGNELRRRHRNDAWRIGSLDPIVKMEGLAADCDVADNEAARRICACCHGLSGIVLSIPTG